MGYYEEIFLSTVEEPFKAFTFSEENFEVSLELKDGNWLVFTIPMDKFADMLLSLGFKFEGMRFKNPPKIRGKSEGD